MKNTLLLYAWLFASCACAQSTWNQKMPFTNVVQQNRFLDAHLEGKSILLSSGDQIAEVDPLGTTIGKATLPQGAYYCNFVRRRTDPSNAEMTFVVGARGFSSSSPYALRLFNPREGFTAAVELSDTLGGTFYNTPAVLQLNDSTYLVAGRKMARMVRIHDNTGFSLAWETPLSLTGICTEILRLSDGYMLVDNKGGVTLLDNNGHFSNAKTVDFNCNGATSIGNGVLVCGENAQHKAVIAQLSLSGDLLWTKEYADLLYNDIQPTLDGNIIVTGKSSAGSIVLHKTNPAGLDLWSQSYQIGFGAKVIVLPDGGYFITALGTDSPKAVYGIKTDALGVTGIQNDQSFVQNRRIETLGVRADLEPSATLFFNGHDLTFISPPDSGTATISAFAPWIGGLDADGQLHLAADDYGPSIYVDFYSGVIGGAANDFKRVWLAKKSEISALRKDFLLDGVLDAHVPYDLLTWPAKGNPNNVYNIDFTKINTDLDLQPAPFIDVNSDGIYNVYEGDYPKIKGDQMAYWMLNDDSVHLNSYGARLRTNLNISWYAFDCPQNQSVQNTLFADFELSNRSSTTYEETYLGFFTDFGLGCYADDYIGSLPEANSYYSYNEDAVDEDCNGVPNFNTNIPLQSVTFQNKSLDHYTYYNNPGFGNPGAAQTDPSVPLENYNYLQGKWKDGTPMTQGGTGYNPGNTNYTDYAFDSNPADPMGWSMCTANLPLMDRRSIATHGPFTFSPNEPFTISLAFTTHWNVPLPCPDIDVLLKPAIEQLSHWSNAGILEQSIDLGIVQQISPGQTISLGTDIPGASFSWSNGASSPVINVSQAGTYSVTVTNEAGCQSIETVQLIPPIGTHSPNQLPNWQVYPNPATDYIEVTAANGTGTAPYKAIIRDALGKIVAEAQSPTNTFSIGLQALPNGFYWLELWQGASSLGSKKIIHYIP